MDSKAFPSIVSKLDLDGYMERFVGFFARSKPIAMPGDIHQHYRYIQALSGVQFPEPPSLPDTADMLIRLQKQAVLGLEELYVFVKTIDYFRKLKAMSLPEPLYGWLSEIEIPEELSEATTLFTDEGEINPEKDETLYGIEEALKRNRAEIRDALYKMAHSAALRDYLVDSQVHLYGGEETLLVRGGFNNLLKATVVGRSSAGHFYVVPQRISALKEREAVLLSDKSALIYRYCKDLSALFRKWERFLRFLDQAFDRFDHYQARVAFARAMSYEFVLPQKEKKIVLHEFAHPAISDPVPLTIAMDRPVMLVTGVNAGGKTMLLKSLLSAVYLSKYLLPFRCNAAKTRIGSFKSVEAIIDDPQSVKNDISTFAGRMREFAALFDKKEAIVGVDEIELGTDSDEAASLFRVLIEKLVARGMWFVVTTHHKRLASLMAGDEATELVAALYDEEKRVPTYTFLQGSIGKSYAFETALRYGIPPAAVEEAKRLYGEDKERLNELIEKSTELERKMRRTLEEAERKAKEAQRRIEKLKEEEERLQEAHRKTLAALEQRYNAAIKRAQEAVKAKESREGRRLLNEAHKRKTQRSTPASVATERTPPKVGDRVKYRTHKGELIAIRGNDATIEVDGLKMRVPLRELRKLSDTSEAKPKVSKRRKMTDVQVEKGGASVSIKLLGMYADEAEEALDKFISDAMLNGLDEVQVIHGTGSGVLAKVVSEYLKRHPKISHFYRMPGNLGVTVVTL